MSLRLQERYVPSAYSIGVMNYVSIMRTKFVPVSPTLFCYVFIYDYV